MNLEYSKDQSILLVSLIQSKIEVDRSDAKISASYVVSRHICCILPVHFYNSEDLVYRMNKVL